ncbi:amidohydrolase family protein [Parafrigoribacterium humi]|jgi:aminocarboxymuconate-semialdehyde decarboxylase|uniref:amidohydrolase family protein n=1 Tax=Parafrigoribacterium humi TaxID=3144664 RepID=UPI0032EB7069
MIIDTHTHFIPRFVLEDTPFGLAYDGSTLSHPEHMRYVIEPRFLGVEARLDEMTRQGIDMSVVSLSPTLFFYDQPSDVAAEYARRANDALAEMVSASDRLVGVATLPLQDPVAAARELDRAVTELGLHGAQIGTNTETLEIDAPALEAVFATAERLDVPMMLHPYFLGAKERLEDFYMTNTLGNPIDTTIAAARLIQSGILDRLPNLRIALVHGGGFLPYQLGRLDRAHEMRAEPRVQIANVPSSYLDRFWFDSITHDDAALKFLAERTGSCRLVLGTDSPFDMEDPEPVRRLARVGIDVSDLTAATQELFGGTL